MGEGQSSRGGVSFWHVRGGVLKDSSRASSEGLGGEETVFTKIFAKSSFLDPFL